MANLQSKLAGKLISSDSLTSILVYEIRGIEIRNNFNHIDNTDEIINIALVNLLYDLKHEPTDEKEYLILGLKKEALNYLKRKINKVFK